MLKEQLEKPKHGLIRVPIEKHAYVEFGNGVDYYKGTATVGYELYRVGNQPGETELMLSGNYEANNRIQTDLPTREKGGFISNYPDFISFMIHQAKSNPVEVAAFSLNDGTYFVQPWVNNTKSVSFNNINGIPGYSSRDVISQYHTHPSGTGPSKDDAKFSEFWNIPVHTVSPNGVIWQVFYPRGYIIPKRSEGFSYGRVINK
jgi:proteasome lid subunit RPN8/RPN11